MGAEKRATLNITIKVCTMSSDTTAVANSWVKNTKETFILQEGNGINLLCSCTELHQTRDLERVLTPFLLLAAVVTALRWLRL